MLSPSQSLSSSIVLASIANKEQHEHSHYHDKKNMIEMNTLIEARRTRNRFLLSKSKSRASKTRVNMAKKQTWTAREVTKDREVSKELKERATVIDENRKVSIPKVMREKDFWDDEQYEKIGTTVGKWGLVIVAIASAFAGIVASRTYNEGAIEVDFNAYDSPTEAVAASVTAVNKANA
jgi:transcription antitermination factor NusA-like protein